MEDSRYEKNGVKHIIYSLRERCLSRTAFSTTAKYSTDEIYVSYGLSFTPMLGELILGLWAVAHKRFNHIRRPKMAFNGKK